MTSLQKNFSMEKLYSDLEKYEANINVARDSRVKRNSSGASLHRNSSNHVSSTKTPIEVRKTSNVERFAKAREEPTRYYEPQRTKKVPIKMENRFYNEKSSLKLSHGHEFNPSKYGHEFTSSKHGHDFNTSKTSSVFRERNSNMLVMEKDGCQENRYSDVNENRYSDGNDRQNRFSDGEEMEFLRECNKLYGLEMRDNMDEGAVKALLGQINKRDEIYELVRKRLGEDCTGEKVREFFLGYERMKAIIDQFKRMSKLSIDDEDELYNFLRSEEDSSPDE